MVREDRKEGDKDMRWEAIGKQGGDKDVEILKERDSGIEKRSQGVYSPPWGRRKNKDSGKMNKGTGRGKEKG